MEHRDDIRHRSWTPGPGLSTGIEGKHFVLFGVGMVSTDCVMLAYVMFPRILFPTEFRIGRAQVGVLWVICLEGRSELAAVFL